MSKKDNDSGALIARKKAALLENCSTETKEGGHEWKGDDIKSTISENFRARSIFATLAKCSHSPGQSAVAQDCRSGR